jgi:exosortase
MIQNGSVTVCVEPVEAGNTLAISHATRWQVTAIAVLVVALYFDVLQGWATVWWEDDSYSHGLLVAPLALFIVWRDRARWRETGSAAGWGGLVVVLAACLTYLLGKLGAEFFLARFSFLLTISGLVWTFLGWQALRRLAFPLLLLTSVIPLPVIVYNSLAAPLQLLASRASTQVTQWLGISVYRDGNIIQLAQTSLGVAEACSGLRSLSSLTVAALLLGFLECSRIRTRVLLVALSIPVAILFNILRVTGTAVLAEQNPDLALGFYHSVTGWLVFVGGFATLFAGMKLLNWILDRKRTTSS